MKRRIFLLFLSVSLIAFPQSSFAFWVWTPESGKWENPKYSVKETPALQLKYALQFYKSKKYKETTRECEKLLRNYPKAKEAPDAQFYIGQVLEDQNKLYEAVKAYQVVIDKYPFSERSVDIVKHQYEIGVGILEGEDKRNAFLEAIAGTNYNIIDIFKTVIKNAPYGPLAAPAQYKIGLYLMEKGLYQESRDELEKVINDYPETEWAKAAQYQIAVADSKRSTDVQYDQKVTKTAADEFEKFLEKNPDAELSTKAKDQIHTLRSKEAENNFIIAQFYEKQKNFKAAKIYYQGVVDDYKETSWAPKALTRLRDLSSKD